VVNASVFVYYPVSLALSPAQPPIYFAEGNNAGKDDLWGANVISVTVGDASTSLSITVHPTYRRNYYRNLALVVNQDSKAYYVTIRVEDALNDDKITSATLYVIDSSGTTVLTVDLKSTGDYGPATTAIGAGAQWRIDIEVVIDAAGGSYDAAPTLSDTSAALKLIYSPTSETPP